MTDMTDTSRKISLTLVCEEHDLDPNVWMDWNEIMKLDDMSLENKQWLYNQCHPGITFSFV